MKFKIILTFILLFVLHVRSSFAGEDSSLSLLHQHENIAIATDLEPDDVLALKIIFTEANRIYQEQQKYPIQLILVGEGKSSIKRLRMEKMRADFFQIPEGVSIKIVEGVSTANNIFPYDGEELFDKETLAEVPDESVDSHVAVASLQEFIEQATNPLIIQIKPAQELFQISLRSDLAEKTAVFFYGGFNLRRTIQDEQVLKSEIFDSVRNDSFTAQYQTFMDHLGSSFKKVSIVETFGLLGPESAVFFQYLWTSKIAQMIENSPDSFLQMFQRLVNNWNFYLYKEEVSSVHKELKSILKLLSNDCSTTSKLTNAIQILEGLEEENYPLIRELLKELTILHPEKQDQWTKIEEGLNFIDKVNPSSGLQFTLADIAVALALIDSTSFFTASPVQIAISKQGYLMTTPDSQSSLFYYEKVDREDFAGILEQFLLKNFSK